MGQNGYHTAVQQDMLTVKAPTVVVPTISIRQPDGSILSRAGKPVIIEDLLNTSTAARLLGMSPRWVQTQCELGIFKTAHKPGQSPRSQWRVARQEILSLTHPATL